MKELSGKVAIITGASKGIGEAAARHMASLGMKVVAVARSEKAVTQVAGEILKAGGEAIGMTCDVSDYAQVKAVVDLTVKTFGQVDVLVNNAGLIDPISRLESSDPEEWGRVIDVNVKGVYYGIHAVLPHMKAQGSGAIINISSGAATSVLEGWSHYCASKAAAYSLTRCTYLEEASNGIRVVGLSPGTVATDMQVSIKASGINRVSRLDPSAHIPPEWVARAIAWLATEDAREYDGDDVSLRDPEIRKRVGIG